MTNTNTSEREETSMAFTPGPWEVDMLSESSAEIRPVDDFTVIARVTRIDTAANAKLIAAGPDMAEALSKIANGAEYAHCIAAGEGEARNFKVLADIARAALSKASI
jgi:hypothetical protein